MNELGGLLDALLSSPDRADGEGADLQGLLSLAGSLLSPKQPDPQPADSAMPDPQLLLSALSCFGQEDKNILLLKALKPHLSEKRAARAEDVIRLMHLLNLLPLLGFFSNEPGERKEKDDGQLE